LDLGYSGLQWWWSRVQAGYDVSLMHGGAGGGEATDCDSATSEPLHVAIAGHDHPLYDIVQLLIDAGASLECKVLCTRL